MKKVLYMNLLYSNLGQRRMDENIIRELVKIAKVYVACPAGYYEHEIEGAKYIDYDYVAKNKSKSIYTYMQDIKNIVHANKLRKKYKFDYYFFASFETLVFPLWMIVAPGTSEKCFLIHNNNIDRMDDRPIKKRFFSLYKGKVNHIFLAEFIRKYAIEKLNIPKDKAYLLPHPLNANDESFPKEYDCVGISNSNDDEWIKQIIKIENERGFFKKNNCRVVLRSKKYSFDNGWLRVINGWMKDDEYNSYINKAKCIFLPFPKSFQYRMSGSVVDAFSNYTTVIGTSIPIFFFYSNKYKNICHIANTPSEFCDIIFNHNENNMDATKEFNEFINEHSNRIVLMNLRKMVCES